MVNYQKSKIYKVISNQTENLYIGSTTKDRLCSRMSEHRSHFRRNTVYYSVFEILKHGDAQIILIENYPCNSKDELLQREQYWIDKTDNCVNKFKAIRSDEEKKKYNQEYMETWKEQNKEHLEEYRKKYHEEKKDDLNEKSKLYRQHNPEYMKQWREKNREKYNQYSREKAKKTREELKELRKLKLEKTQ